MAEWLRRLTRNKLDQKSDGVTRVGSNPTHCEFFLNKSELKID